jgi:hypothetical protein
MKPQPYDPRDKTRSPEHRKRAIYMRAIRKARDKV